jgi:hypothetical protein
LNVFILLGKFGYVLLSDDKSYQLKTGSGDGGINGIDQQCLIYYYYMSTAEETTLTVLKQESKGASEIIDFVTGSPYNGWIQRKVSFVSDALGYEVRHILENTFQLYIIVYVSRSFSICKSHHQEHLISDSTKFRFVKAVVVCRHLRKRGIFFNRDCI